MMDDKEVIAGLAEGRWTRNIHGALVGLWRFARANDPTGMGAYSAADEVANTVNCKLVSQLLLTFEPDAPYKTTMVDRPGFITAAWMRAITKSVHMAAGRAVMDQQQTGSKN